MFSLTNDMNERDRERWRERERERERDWGDRKKDQKVESKDRRNSMFGNSNKI